MPDPQPLPELLLERLRRLGEAFETDLVEGLGTRPVPVARVQTLRADPATLAEELRERGLEPAPVAGLPEALSFPADHRAALIDDPAVLDGRIYIQNAASQRAARALDARPGERILDLAAAPGGKTLALANAMEDRGEIVAVDPVRDRHYRLRANLERVGVQCVTVLRADGRRLPRDFRGAFDRVLLDAPCSSDVRLDPSDPETFRRWSLGKVRDLARKQWGLLGAALWAVRPGGVVVYSTCTFAPEEDEGVLAAHLGDRGTAELLPIDLGEGVRTVPGVSRWLKKRWPEELSLAQRILPDRIHEGFFAAKLRRRDDAP